MAIISLALCNKQILLMAIGDNNTNKKQKFLYIKRRIYHVYQAQHQKIQQ